MVFGNGTQSPGVAMHRLLGRTEAWWERLNAIDYAGWFNTNFKTSQVVYKDFTAQTTCQYQVVVLVTIRSALRG